MPLRIELISLFIVLTALRTPLPKYLESLLSLFSLASCFPVEAPEGTKAIDFLLLLSITSAAIVGLPLESNTSYARTCFMKLLLILI